MFPVDSLPPQYCEERIAADQAKREVERQRQLAALHEAAKQVHQITSQHQQQQSSSASSLSQAMRQQRPPLSRPASAGFLGNVFQGFVRTRSSPSTPTTRTPSPSNQKQLGDSAPVAPVSKTPAVESIEQKRKRDEDLACFLGRA